MPEKPLSIYQIFLSSPSLTFQRLKPAPLTLQSRKVVESVNREE